MATKPQRPGKNSIHQVVKLASELSEQVALPEGVSLRDDAEMVIWGQFTRARTREGWRDFDLLIVAKSVRLEADIREYQGLLDRSGPIISTQAVESIQASMAWVTKIDVHLCSFCKVARPRVAATLKGSSQLPASSYQLPTQNPRAALRVLLRVRLLISEAHHPSCLLLIKVEEVSRL